MKDYLRKNSKWILTIFSVFLMLAWLVNPNQRERKEVLAGTKIGALDGKTITNGSLVEADNILAIFHLIPMGTSGTLEDYAMYLLRLDRKHANLQIFLMIAEAKKYHLGYSQQEVQNLLAELGIGDENAPVDGKSVTLRSLAKAMTTDTAYIRRALGDFILAGKVRDLTLAASDPSLPELRHLTAESSTLVDARYLLFDARFPSTEIPEPTPAQLAEQFADYKSVLPVGFGDHPDVKGHQFPYGYKYPDRVQVEYLLFDRDTLLKLPVNQSTPDDFSKARRLYDADPSRFKRTIDPSATQPSTMPAYLSYDEVKAKLVDTLVQSRVDTQLRAAVTLVTQKLTMAAFDPTLDADGYRVRLTDDKKTPVPYVSYEKVADEVQKQFGFRPAVVVASLAPPSAIAGPSLAPRTAEWLNILDLAKLPGIGQAEYVSQGQSRGRFDDLAMSVRDLHPTTDVKKLKNAALRMQVGVEGPMLMDQKGNGYVFRVIESSPEHEPAGVDEVKTAVSMDLRQRAAFERFVAEAPARVDNARKFGIDELAKNLSMSWRQTDRFYPIVIDGDSSGFSVSHVSDPIIHDVGQSDDNATLGRFPDFSRAVYRIGASNQLSAATQMATPPPSTAASQPATAASEPATEPALSNMFLGNGHPVGFVSSEARLQVFVFEVTRFAPPNPIAFEQKRYELAGSPIDNTTFRNTKTDLQMIADRLKFVPVTPFDVDTSE